MTSARGDQSMLRDINMKTSPAMSALPPKADMCSATRHVRFVPKADILGYSITSSARPISVLGTVRPSALAVLRLMMKLDFGGFVER